MRARLELTTLFALALAVYLPHIAEEALTGMHDDPGIVLALSPLAGLSPRHAVYLTFQVMMLVTLVTALLVSRGGKPRLLVLAVLGVSLLGEAHHLVHALFTLQYNSGLVTSLPMPVVGVILLRRVLREWATPSPALPSP